VIPRPAEQLISKAVNNHAVHYEYGQVVAKYEVMATPFLKTVFYQFKFYLDITGDCCYRNNTKTAHFGSVYAYSIISPSYYPAKKALLHKFSTQ